ncbi:GmrSD restriction endonuclease domain-containing protein [Actinokineospora iranica]|uniref:6-O-methylguanine DNA methyltransferase, DNA binding domain n=1 Tax=Actinokineospora iranica TaxID=1271860 RepID=A0A1G6SK26_9PSEU|nr:DUF262 domain-containing protein [Actinokineospora iranica]SDD17280.1 6-O-methylguanine DNA methyltransferase, DNA binding domain [Actinokineospora iranica]
MRASETVLRNLLQGEKQYVVPLYQRPYSWKRDQLDQLWLDITNLLSEEDDDDGHFLGSVVLAPSLSNTASGVQSWLVVDGQQRITTLSILLCTIRDYCATKIDNLARKIEVQYLVNEFAQGDERYTLLPTQADRKSWKDIVEKLPQAGGEDAIGNAYRFFKGQLEKYLSQASERPEFAIQRLEQVVVSRLSFVEISAQTGDNVHRIFESLNNTGLKLTQADLLRNYLFMRLPANADRIYQQHWLPMQSGLNDQNLVDLIWLDLILKGKRGATLHSLYREQQKFLDRLELESDVEEWIVELSRKAQVFKRVLRPEQEPVPIIREALDRLNRWRATVVYPITMMVLLAYEDGQLEPQAVADALRIVESYLVRQLIVGIGRAGNNVMINDLVKSLSDEIPTQEAITRILTRQRRRFPSDDDVREAMLEQPFYWRGKEWQKYFILRSLEEAQGRVEIVDFAASKLTIEHVMPQTLNDEWSRTIEDECAEDEGIDDLHQSLVHTIGNLTLSAYNAKLSNKGFSEKKKLLAESGLISNLKIADNERWGKAEIRHRSSMLADLAIQMWPGPGDSVPYQPESRKLALVRQALSEIPSGRWTNYLTIAQICGTHRRSLSKWLVEYDLPNGHRVLKSDGSIPASGCHRFQNIEDQIHALSIEGVTFQGNGRASEACRIGMTELMRLSQGDLGEADHPTGQGVLNLT